MRESRWVQQVRTLVRDGIIPIGVLTIAGLTIREILRTVGLESGTKILGVIVVIQTLAILGMATLLLGAKTNAANRENKPDEPIDA